MPSIPRQARIIPGTVKLSHGQFVRFVAQRSGVAQVAIAQAMKVLSNGLRDALSEGHAVLWEGVGLFEVRELKPRIRYVPGQNRHQEYDASCRVHFKVSKVFTRDILRLAQKRLEKFSKAHPVQDENKGK